MIKPTKKIAIYAGTFAPITLGHLDIIEAACDLFDEVVIAVSRYQRAELGLTQELRIQMIEASVEHLSNCKVMPLQGSAVSFAQSVDARWLVRGIRNSADLALEQSMANMNQQLNESLQTVFLQPKPEHQTIQATLVRQLIACGEDVSRFVPNAALSLLRLSK